MEYLAPVLIVVVVGAAVVGAAWWLSRRAPSASGGTDAPARERRGGRRPLAGRVSSESARAAAGRLDRESHREVYRLIAAGRTSDAVLAYRQSTGLGTFESMLDIQALSAYPQMWARPGSTSAAPGTPGTPGSTGGSHRGPRTGSPQDSGTRPTPERAPGQEQTPEVPRESEEQEGPAVVEGAPAGGAQDADSLVVPQDWLEEPLPADRPFELEVVRDEATVRVSSADLPPFLRDQLTAMVRDGRVEEAALELSAHTVLTPEEALQFLQILRREQGFDD